MRQTYRTGLALAALALIALPATKTCAADYPDRPVRVVVPFAAAGVTDVVARVVFDRIGQVTGKTFVIDTTVPAPAARSRLVRSRAPIPTAIRS